MNTQCNRAEEVSITSTTTFVPTTTTTTTVTPTTTHSPTRLDNDDDGDNVDDDDESGESDMVNEESYEMNQMKIKEIEKQTTTTTENILIIENTTEKNDDDEDEADEEVDVFGEPELKKATEKSNIIETDGDNRKNDKSNNEKNDDHDDKENGINDGDKDDDDDEYYYEYDEEQEDDKRDENKENGGSNKNNERIIINPNTRHHLAKNNDKKRNYNNKNNNDDVRNDDDGDSDDNVDGGGIDMSTSSTLIPSTTTNDKHLIYTRPPSNRLKVKQSGDDDKVIDDDENIENVKRKLDVTRVNGRYMSVDNDQLAKYDQILAKKSKKKSAKNTPPTNPEIKYYSEKEFLSKMYSILKNDRKPSRTFKKDHGACFTGTDSYLHFSDAETMRQIISYQIDLNLRFKTHSANGLILWSGRHTANEDDDFLSLGIENGYLHLRYNLGSGEVNIKYNSTKVSDGLWHRVRANR